MVEGREASRGRCDSPEATLLSGQFSSEATVGVTGWQGGCGGTCPVKPSVQDASILERG